MGAAVFSRALVQGSHQAAASAGVTPRKGSLDTFRQEYDPKTGQPVLKFTIEDQVIVDGVVRVANYINCVVKEPALVEFFRNHQWNLVKMAGSLNWNRDYKSLTVTVERAEVLAAPEPVAQEQAASSEEIF